MRLTSFVLASTALALPNPPKGEELSEYIYFNNAGMVLDRDSETKVVGFGITLRPSGVRCDAANFTLPSLDLNCGDSGYAIAIDKVTGFYSRFTARISHLVEDGVILVGNITFGMVGPLPFIRDQFGSANGTLTVTGGR